MERMVCEDDAGMGILIRRTMELVRFVLLFFTCALLSYGVITFLTDHFLPSNPYREPVGNAIKVVNLLQEKTTSHQPIDYSRLQLFYLEGE